jgi:high-affinity nickel permease
MPAGSLTLIIKFFFQLGSLHGLVALLTLVVNMTLLFCVKNSPWKLEDFTITIVITTVSVFLLSVSTLIGVFQRLIALILFRYNQPNQCPNS